MKKLFIILGVLFTQTLYAQNYVHQVLILNEGYFDYTTNQIIEPVTIGSYDPVTETYTQVATIDSARFASDMIIDGEYFYVAADNKILKYDLNNYNLLEETIVPGVRKLLTDPLNNLFATRGEYMTTFDSYLHVYDKNDLTLTMAVDTINGPKWSTQDMVIYQNLLYIAINNGFEWGNEKGLIGVLDIIYTLYNGGTMGYDEVDLGPDGKNPDNMMIDGTTIYTVNNKDWSGCSVSQIDIGLNAQPVTTTNMSTVSTGCGTSAIRNGNVNYQISGDTEIYEWNGTYSTPTGMSQNFYELAVDNVNNYLYASSTDWFSYGEVFIYDNNNILLNSFSCGVSPGTIVFDERMYVGIEEINNHIKDEQPFDVFGRKINTLPYGIYIKNGKKYVNIQ